MVFVPDRTVFVLAAAEIGQRSADFVKQGVEIVIA